VNGHFLDTEEEKNVLKQIHDLGFAIGNHTYSHPNLKDLNETEQSEELVKLNDTVENIIGERPVFFRAPFGANTDYSRELAKEQNMLTMNWTFGYDWEEEYRDSGSLIDIMVNTPYLTDGAILLMHDRQWTAESLAGVVEGLRASGYELIDPATIKGIEQK
jgi:peptidoglycan/xylan/chitin deacetylase (PgdA/CDA1 family)